MQYAMSVENCLHQKKQTYDTEQQAGRFVFRVKQVLLQTETPAALFPDPEFTLHQTNRLSCIP
jgi:hypothetical protein